MKAAPILFSAPMIRALLDGRKTQTRRVLKPSWHPGLDPPKTRDKEFSISNWPYGQPGDVLWVRETWSINGCGSRVSIKPEAWPSGFPVGSVRYPATDDAPAVDEHGNPYWWNKRHIQPLPPV